MKYVRVTQGVDGVSSPSTRRVWIEIIWRITTPTEAKVTLHAEGVD